MWQVVIVKMDVTTNAIAGLARAVIIVQIDFIVLQTTPKSFNGDVVCCTTFTIHADTNVVFFQQIDVLRTRKMAALVTVNNTRRSPRSVPDSSFQEQSQSLSFDQAASRRYNENTSL